MIYPIAGVTLRNLTPHRLMLTDGRQTVTIEPETTPAELHDITLDDSRLLGYYGLLRGWAVAEIDDDDDDWYDDDWDADPQPPILDIPIEDVRRGARVTYLPDPQPDTFLIVSRAVAEAEPARRDLYFPLHYRHTDHGVEVESLGQVHPDPRPLVAELVALDAGLDHTADAAWTARMSERREQLLVQLWQMARSLWYKGFWAGIDHDPDNPRPTVAVIVLPNGAQIRGHIREGVLPEDARVIRWDGHQRD
ncbi:MAG: hypothetical protein FWJ65_12335, partial [Limnochordales bacterium]